MAAKPKCIILPTLFSLALTAAEKKTYRFSGALARTDIHINNRLLHTLVDSLTYFITCEN